MSERVREPIQTYLSRDERAELDRVAAELGVSRSEALRRGVEALAANRAGAPPARAAAATVERTGATPGSVTPGPVLTPAKSRAPGPPPSLPVAPLERLLAELDQGRSER